MQASEAFQLQIIASGMHLSPEFGMTVEEMQSDGFEPDEKVEMLLSGDTPTAICKSMGLAMISYGGALQRLKPDILILLGDRFETLCMAAAAQVCRLPIAHIHGGETTEGAIDESFRHSITKMSHLHFASCEAYRKRIIQLGEAPEKVFDVGALGVENIRRISLMGRSELEESIGINLEKPYFLVTFHPITLNKDTSDVQFQSLLDALDAFKGYNVIFTKANADTDGRVINQLVEAYAGKYPKRCLAVTSLGVRRYLSAMKYCTAVIGSSSSGIIEAPTFKVPTVNIGDRQKGRVRAKSIIDCKPTIESISAAMEKALSFEFRNSLQTMSNPYERKDTAKNIINILKKADLANILKKKFFDIESGNYPISSLLNLIKR